MSQKQQEKLVQQDKTEAEALALLQGIIKKDQKAMETFYRHFSGAVYQFALKTLVNGADASEVMNEVFMEVWKKADTFSQQSKVKTWLLSITHFKAVDLVRRKAKHDKVDSNDAMLDSGESDIEHSHSAYSCSLEKMQAGSQNKRHVSQCMGELKEAQRHVVYLAFYEELGYPDIANILSIPAGTVKTRMMHAKQVLLSCISRLSGKTI